MQRPSPKDDAEAFFNKDGELQLIAQGYRTIVDNFLYHRSPEEKTQLGAFISAIENSLPPNSDESPQAAALRAACDSALETTDKLKDAMSSGASPQHVRELIEAFLTFWGDTALLLLPDSKIDAHKERDADLSSQNKSNVEARHNKPGGSRAKRALVVEAWKSGHYSTKDLCAEQEAAALGLSFATARKALRNQ